MSLINEALKKAQGQRQGQQGTTPPGPPVTPSEPHHPHGPGKGHRRSFIWGFVMAVLVVGLFTTLLTTFFVYQFLGEESTGETAQQVSPSPEAKAEAKTEPATAGNPEDAMEGVAAQPADAKAPQSGTEEIPLEQDATPEPALESIPVEGTPSAGAVAKAPPQPPNPAVVSRLLELEIRGALGGSKVLILDQATGRTKAYKVGDTLEGSMGLVVEEIRSSSVKFKDYAGSIHSKSF